MNIWKGLRYARKASFRGTHSQHRIGVAICKGSVVLSKGYNQIRRARIGESFSEYKESLHAERHACLQLQKDNISGTDMYIYRETKNGKPACARPCKRCQELIRSVGIRRVIYSNSEFPYYKIERIVK